MPELWGIVAVLAILVIYYFVNREYAKKLALEFMFYVEKKAEELALTEGKKKFYYVVSQYDKLPAFVKAVITPDQFAQMVQQLFDEAISRLDNKNEYISPDK
ncbi:MAG: hypothetical protein JG776_2435 [Caloramator sp.]|jgi:hypothetical protein|uniref:hypothetical protein n=1 Tax=Caloramator sp. TaxID=1871330 RepID=UPI001D98613B|nr:hypothetical protein [Caloramator sp.]MBZ4664711.1 hypothetical protein [Caloramator sp.]